MLPGQNGSLIHVCNNIKQTCNLIFSIHFGERNAVAGEVLHKNETNILTLKKIYQFKR